MEDKLNMPGAVIARITTTKHFAYNKGDMNFSVDVNVDSKEQVKDMLDIMSICKGDLDAELAKFTDNEKEGSVSTGDIQPVSEGEEA